MPAYTYRVTISTGGERRWSFPGSKSTSSHCFTITIPPNLKPPRGRRSGAAPLGLRIHPSLKFVPASNHGAANIPVSRPPEVWKIRSGWPRRYGG